MKKFVIAWKTSRGIRSLIRDKNLPGHIAYLPGMRTCLSRKPDTLRTGGPIEIQDVFARSNGNAGYVYQGQ